MLYKKVVFWAFIILMVFAVIGGIEWTQLLLPGAFALLAGSEIWNKSKFHVAIMVIGLVGVLINVYLASWIDVVPWAAVLAVWWKPTRR